MNRYVIAYSSKSSSTEDFIECCRQIDENGSEPEVLIYFSECNSFKFFTEGLYRRYPDSISIGSTTYRAFCSKGESKEGFCILAVFSGIKASSGILCESSKQPIKYRENIISALSPFDDFENMCCLEFTAAGTKGEELVLDAFASVLKDKGILIAGTSSFSDFGKGKNYVGLNGFVYDDSTVFVFLKNLNGKIFACRENIYRPTDRMFEVTDVDCEDRIVYEFNNEPATSVVAKTLNVDEENLRTALIKNPMGRIIDNEIFITSYSEINPDKSISFLARIYNCTKMVLLEIDDFESVWKKTAETVSQNVKESSFSIVINCFLRDILFEQSHQYDKFVSMLKSNYGNFIGVSGLGEQLGNLHLNQTMVLLIFE